MVGTGSRRPARHPDPGPRGARGHPPRRHRASSTRPAPSPPAGWRCVDVVAAAGWPPTTYAGWPRPSRPPRSTRWPGRVVAGHAAPLPPVDRLRGAGGLGRPRHGRGAGGRGRPPGCSPTAAAAAADLPAAVDARGVGRADAPVAVGWDERARGVARGRRHGEADLRRGRARAARARAVAGAAHRRQRAHRSRRRRRGRHRRGRRRGAARGQGGRGAPAPGRRAAWWPWSATASTTRRRSRRPTSGSPWAPAPTSPIEAADLTIVGGDLRAAADAVRLSRRDAAHDQGQPGLGVRLQRRGDPARRRRPAQPDDRRRRDGPLQRRRRHQQPPPAPLRVRRYWVLMSTTSDLSNTTQRIASPLFTFCSGSSDLSDTGAP